jgi:CRP-like cAMP-binding protein
MLPNKNDADGLDTAIAHSDQDFWLPFVEQLRSSGRIADEEADALSRLPGRHISVAANKPVLTRREPAIAIVVSGLTAHCIFTSAGERQITALHITGDACNLSTIAAPDPQAELVALTDSALFLVPRASIEQVADRYPNLVRAFWSYCTRQMLLLQEWALSLGRYDARQSMARLICEMAARHGRFVKIVRQRSRGRLLRSILAKPLALPRST